MGLYIHGKPLVWLRICHVRDTWSRALANAAECSQSQPPDIATYEDNSEDKMSKKSL
ncbi:hypothetical protein CISG_09942 [Coccidioides immitis RMSCC 3703]|uniref:Uncharacterized protein n=2 Tax=Coccidioides immitis TaxID=5501 RepID=A0A0J8QNX1_COCIT|nr:hypothetical protein CIRG_03821 [Coccidioides immitis RMSCC 2394]KMU72978.1 hypothetical protein CISG_09942 [Coccidioides immitis RMSCC 3703]